MWKAPHEPPLKTVSCQFGFPRNQNLQQKLMCRYWIEIAHLCNFSEVKEAIEFSQGEIGMELMSC